MVNEVNKLIYNTLAEHNAVVLPRVGSLGVVRRMAKMEGNRVVAPTFAVEFSSAEEGVSLCDVIASVANISSSEAEDIYLRWLDKVKEGNTLTISGVGTLRDKSFVTDTELQKALNLADKTPIKIHSCSRKPYIAVAAVVVRIYAFLLLFLCGMMEFASTFMPIGIQLSNPLVWNYSLFSEPAYTYGTDILKAIAVAAGLCFAKKYILVRRTDFFYG